MARKAPRHERLFDPGKPVPKQVVRERHLQLADPPSEQVRLPGENGLVYGLTDGLPVRVVKPHSADKARMVRADLGTVGRAMRRQWFNITYFELFAGPGLLLDDVTGEEVPGSPLEALAIKSPFDHYIFSDYSLVAADALQRRIGPRPNVKVMHGDANGPAHLGRVCSLIDPKALVIAYLDPAKPNLHFETVRFIAERFRHIDFIINLPFSGIHRSLAAGGYELPVRMLNHSDPVRLLHPDKGRTAQNIREHYDAQLRSLGLDHIARRCVNLHANNSPLYDIVLASRHPLAVELWEKANRKPAPPQLGLGDIEL
jgi:three-Cys-motif partner protein